MPNRETDVAPEPEPEPEPASLDALRRRIEEAIQTIKQLRATNAALEERVRDLEKRPAVHPDHAFFSVPRTPDALKNDLRSFIETLDEHIERAHKNA